MTDEKGGGTEDVEAEKNSKDKRARPRPQEGCLCRRGAGVESSDKCGYGGREWVQSGLQSCKELLNTVFREWNCLPCNTACPGTGKI